MSMFDDFDYEPCCEGRKLRRIHADIVDKMIADGEVAPKGNFVPNCILNALTVAVNSKVKAAAQACVRSTQSAIFAANPGNPEECRKVLQHCHFDDKTIQEELDFMFMTK